MGCARRPRDSSNMDQAEDPDPELPEGKERIGTPTDDMDFSTLTPRKF